MLQALNYLARNVEGNEHLARLVGQMSFASRRGEAKLAGHILLLSNFTPRHNQLIAWTNLQELPGDVIVCIWIRSLN